MPLFPNVEAFLLAGGKSSRMGRNKALLEINGEPLVQRTASLLTPLVRQITLVISAAQSSSPENKHPYSDFKLPVIIDRLPNAGPLGGITTALSTAQSAWCLTLACDMPFLTKVWLKFLLNQIAHAETESPQQIQAIIPETTRGLEPLCAIYRSTCAPILTAALEQGVRKVTDAIANLNMKHITENEWRRFSSDGNLFGNLNTWQDYLDSQQRLKF
jgi:molybdopterin-guanine dinucleotide biosynthesis protein A